MPKFKKMPTYKLDFKILGNFTLNKKVLFFRWLKDGGLSESLASYYQHNFILKKTNASKSVLFLSEI